MSTTGVANAGKMKILIADDHDMVLDVFAMYLSSASDMEVATAKNLDDAVEMITESGPYDVVLLDLNMPGMNGVAGLRRAIKMNGGKPVAIITGNPTPADAGRDHECRVFRYCAEDDGRAVLGQCDPIHACGRTLHAAGTGARAAQCRAADQERAAVDKEMMVLSYLAEGKQNKEIANDLKLASRRSRCLSPRSARSCRRRTARRR